MVGQRFITLLDGHPWFEVTTIAASARSAGKRYEDAVGDKWKMEKPMPDSVKDIVVKDVADVEDVASGVDFVFSALNMPKDEIREIEEAYAKTETPVVSNNSAHRWTPDVPMVVLRSTVTTMTSLRSRRRDSGQRGDLSQLSLTARSSAILLLLRHGRNSGRRKSSYRHTRRSPVLQRHLRNGLR